MSSVKVSDTWEDIEAPYVKVGGSWNIAKSAWTKLSGEWKSWFLQGGVLDRALGGEDDPQYPNFATNTGTGANNGVLTIVTQSDGKILLAGGFSTFNGTTANRIVRLNSDGTRDTAFTTNIGTGGNNTPMAIVEQSDGKILLAGYFTTWNGTTANRIVRLNSDGTKDTSFNTNTGTVPNNAPTSLATQSDGKILVGGLFTTWNGTTVGRIVRLNSDGTRDTAFTTNTGTGGNYSVDSIAIQSDGKILLGGLFTTWNGTTVTRIVRLNSNGTRDTAFTTNTGTGANSTVSSIVAQSDGKILVGGNFSTFNGTTVTRIVRLNSNGTRDTTFTTNTGTGANSAVDSIVTQSDGKILVAGDFTTFNGTTASGIVRLNSDGTADTAFVTNTGTGAASGSADPIAIQSDGKILVGGSFSIWNGNTVNRIVRLNSDGTADSQPGLSATVNSIAIQSDGKILLGGAFINFDDVTVNRIVRLSSGGTRDTTFTTNTGTGANGAVDSIVTQSDGKILIIGQFTTFNGSTVNRTVRLNSDGTRDTAFTTNIGTGAESGPDPTNPWDDSPGPSDIDSIAIQADGKILLGGRFETWDSSTVNRIVRLNSDGTRDTAFTTNTGTGANSTVYSIVAQTDGKILLAGGFNTLNGTTANRTVRLNSDGTRDTAFTTNIGTGGNSTVWSIAVQTDGKILVGGQFNTWNGTSALRIVRLNSNGTIDTAFNTNMGTGPNSNIYPIAIQSDGKILVGGNFTTWNGTTVTRIVRLNSNGTIDTAFNTNMGTGANSTVYSIVAQTDGKILVGGDFTTFNNSLRYRIARLGGGEA